MNLTKIIPVILLVFMLGIGGIAWTFYSQTQELSKDNEQLKSENAGLLQDNQELRVRHSSERDKRESLEERLSRVSADLTRLEEERESLNARLSKVTQERDLLAERLSKSAQPQAQVSVRDTTTLPVTLTGAAEDHWADFVRKKAALEAKVDSLNKELLDTKAKITQLDKENKELSIKIDQLNKTKEQVEEEMKFKERTLRVLSMDLVSEREERGAAVTELRKLRSENVSLKREIVLANNEKLKLQEGFKTALEKKEGLESKVTDVENVLKEKSLAFEEMQSRLESAIAGAKQIGVADSASVQLPPIVVRPEAPGLRGLRGKVIAVNKEEEFVVVDIGEASGIRPGTLLKVMRGDREIATLEVIETRREISAADIKEVVGGLTIQVDDIVISR